MKKILLTAAFAVAAMAASAQYYVGGSAGIQFNGKDSGIDPKFGINISPMVGYTLNDKMDAGLEVIFSFQKDQEPTETKYTSFGLAPYLRYTFYQFGKFGVLGKGSVFFLSQTQKSDATGKQSTFALGLGVIPQITFDVTDKVQLFADLNFLAFNFAYVNPEGDSFSMFNVGVDANNITQVGDLQIGFIYRF